VVGRVRLVTALNLHGMTKAIFTFSDFWFEV